MAEGVTISGVNEVNSSLKKLASTLENNLSFNKELSSDLAKKASAVAPRLTGALASSVEGNGTQRKVQILAGSAAVPYAGVIEYGWPQHNIEARPYLRPTVQKNMNYIIAKYEDDIKANIKKYNLD